jgi:hypothetical protein
MGMRAFLELLGLIPPSSDRREPVALPAWTRYAVPALVALLSVVSVLIVAAVRLLAT